MAYRSESNRIGNKLNYTDLNLTHYPNNLDSRLNNENMKGFVNVGEASIPDFVMAEYVNAALDGIMALQRSLGVSPQVPVNTPSANVTSVTETNTVSKRIGALESGLLDERYGGAGWPGSVYANRPTLSKHAHTGLGGHPNKIGLTTEVSGLLPKQNINLTTTGLTGKDILTSPTNTRTIEASLNDMLSKSTGGVVLGLTEFRAGVRTSTLIEASAPQFKGLSGASLTSDTTATVSTCVRASGTQAGTFHTESLNRNLFFGRYAISLRAKVSNRNVSTNVLRVTVGTQNFYFRGTDFTTANKYQTLYFVFEHSQVETLTIAKVASTGTIDLSVDNFSIHPVHPAVFDR